MADTPSSSPLPVQRDADGIVTLTLEQPGSAMVVLDEALIRRIEMALLALPRDMTGFVLASGSPRVFIAGADLKTIQANPSDSGDDRRLEGYLAYGQRVFGAIAELPCPTVAAIGGAALGGGLEIAMHCDGLIGAPGQSGKPYPIGLPEAGLSICPGWGGTNLLPARMNAADAIRRTCAGKPMTYDEAAASGLFDQIAPSPDALLATARQWVLRARERMGRPGGTPRRDGAPSRWIGRPEVKPRVLAALAEVGPEFAPGQANFTESAKTCLDAIRAGLDRGWQAALEVERRELTRLRNTPAGKAAIQAFFEKSRK